MDDPDMMTVERLPKRIANKIDVDPSGCWLWTACRHPKDGYGEVYFAGAHTSAHRAVYQIMKGPIPSGMHTDHLCRVRHCVNPAHLDLVTPQENTRRAAALGMMGKAWSRRSHCLRGHPFDEKNTHYRADGTRDCRACGREDKRRAYWRDRGQPMPSRGSQNG